MTIRNICLGFLSLFIVFIILPPLILGPTDTNTQVMTASNLMTMMKEKPDQITTLVFINGSDSLYMIPKDGNIRYLITLPQGGGNHVMQHAQQNGVSYAAKAQSSGIARDLMSWIPTLLFIAFLYFFWMRRVGKAALGPMNFLKSNHRTKGEKTSDRVTFAHIAGQEEAKAELEQIIDFLKHPNRYLQAGGKMPKGVLLTGPPGTGKTLLARAVANEADAPFFSVNGSDFVEMFVGVGAARVRDLFAQGKGASRRVIFIDELDALAKARGGARFAGGNDEREQAVNQLLVEMDGFDQQNEGVIVIAATNRPEVLDQALLRPGRFDRQIVVGRPDKAGRKALFTLYFKGKPVAQDVDLDHLVEMSPGMSGADIANVCNEAALWAVQRTRFVKANSRGEAVVITTADFDEAMSRTIGVRRNTVMSETEKRQTAAHEAAHALVAELIEGGERVGRISIIPRGQTGGHTQTFAEEEGRYTRQQLYAKIAVALAGRAGQVFLFDTEDTGASNDFAMAELYAMKMVTEFGMSELGFLSLKPQGLLEIADDGSLPTSQDLLMKVERAKQQLKQKAYEEVQRLLKENEAALNRIIEALLKNETLLRDEFLIALFNSPSTGTRTDSE